MSYRDTAYLAIVHIKHDDVNKIYIKLPLYVADWLRWKYKSKNKDAITLPPTLHKAGAIIYLAAISNPLLKPISTLSYSHRAMTVDKEYLPREMLAGLPSDDSRRFLVAFELPEAHTVSGRWVDNSECMQLTQKDAKTFSEIVTKEMFDDLDKFKTGEWEDWAITLGYKKNDFANMLGCWLNARDIDQDHYENILRVCRRAQEKEGNRPKDIRMRERNT